MESINIYVQLVKVHQVGDIVAVLFVLLDIIHRMLDQITVHCVHKVISVPDEIKTQFHAILDKYLMQDIQRAVYVLLALIQQLVVVQSV
jgi:predicted HTH transcriptional regulator